MKSVDSSTIFGPRLKASDPRRGMGDLAERVTIDVSRQMSSPIHELVLGAVGLSVGSLTREATE